MGPSSSPSLSARLVSGLKRLLRPEARPLLALTMLALVVRLAGITWGLPDARHMFSYHPDEGVNLFNGVLQGGRPRPHADLGFYNYGSVFFYLWQFAAAISSTYGIVRWQDPGGSAAATADSIGAYLLVGRLCTLTMGVLATWGIYLLGRRLHSRRAGLTAAAFWALAPVAVVHGQFATVDVTATAMGVAVALAAERLVRRTSAEPLILCGALAGVAAASKYTLSVSVALPMVAILVSPRGGSAGRRAALLAATALCALVGFLLACPGVVMNWARFSSDVAFEASKSAQGMGLLFAGTGNGYVYHITSSLRIGLGWPLLLPALAGLVWACLQRRASDAVPAAFLLLYFALIGAAQVRYLRYVLPMIPFLALFAGRLADDLICLRPRIVWAGTAATGVLAAILCAGWCLTMRREDPRDQAADYLARTLPPGASVAFATTPWYWSPPLHPAFTAPASAQNRAMVANDSPGRWVFRMPSPGTEWDAGVIESRPAAVVVSDLESQDAYRLGVPEAERFRALLRRDFTSVSFSSRGFVLGRGPIPNDMLYVCPTITVYEPRR